MTRLREHGTLNARTRGFPAYLRSIARRLAVCIALRSWFKRPRTGLRSDGHGAAALRALRLCSVCLMALMGSVCWGEDEAAASQLLGSVTLTGESLSVDEASNLELGLAAARGQDGTVVVAHPTDSGTELCLVKGDETLWTYSLGRQHNDLSLCVAGSEVFAAASSEDRRGIIILRGKGTSWMRSAEFCPVSRGEVYWPSLRPVEDGPPHIVCFVRTPGGLNDDAECGLYEVVPDSATDRWKLIGKGLQTWTSAPVGAPSQRLVYVRPNPEGGGLGWCVACVDGSERKEQYCPPQTGMVLDAVVVPETGAYVLWEKVSGDPPRGLMLSTVRDGETETTHVPLSYSVARIAPLPGGEASIIGPDGWLGLERTRSGYETATRPGAPLVSIRADLKSGTLQKMRLCTMTDLAPDMDRAVGMPELRGVVADDGGLHLVYVVAYPDRVETRHLFLAEMDSDLQKAAESH